MVTNSFELASEVEREAMLILIPYLKRICSDAEFIVTSGQLFIQKFLGDLIIKRNGRTRFIEIKAERKHTGNLFLETWSNRSQQTHGWMHSSLADLLWYYFLDENKLYTVQMSMLKSWAFGANGDQGRIYGFPERPQGIHVQMNDTWGRVVPVSTLKDYCATFGGPIDPKNQAFHNEIKQAVLFR